MQFEIVTTEEKLKKHFERDYRTLSMVCLFMYTIIVFALCSSFIQTDFGNVMKYYFIGLIILAIFLYILTKITTRISLYMLKHVVHYKYGTFTEVINEKGITEVLDDDAISLKWSEVGKVVTAYKFIIVKPKDKKAPSFLYRKKHFKTEEEYQEVVDTIHKYYQLYLEKEGKKHDRTHRSKKRRNR